MNTLFLYNFISTNFNIEIRYRVFLSIVLFKLNEKFPSLRFNLNNLIMNEKIKYLYRSRINARNHHFSKFPESENKFNLVINNNKTYKISLANLYPPFGLVLE